VIERLDDNAERQLRLLVTAIRRNVARVRAAGRAGEVHAIVRVATDGRLLHDSPVTTREYPFKP
jgi:hypothetical protein